MIRKLDIVPTDTVVLLTTDIVYGHRTEFCGAQYIPLKLSLMKPRMHFPYDKEVDLPVIVFLCGGGWMETDHNAWIPELVWFAKMGYAVASVQYPVTAATRFPDSMNAVEAALNFLKNQRELKIDPDRIMLMGESAGAYLALLCAAELGSDILDAVVAFYPPVGPMQLIDHHTGECTIELPNGADKFPSLLDIIGNTMPPVMILHGTEDELVPKIHGEKIYQRLQELGIPSELLLIEGANHAENHFFQEPVKKQISEFLENATKYKQEESVL